MQKIIFITGTDTNVGKTVLTALLLSHLRQTGSAGLAIKPFCSGGRVDAELLRSLQPGNATLDAINPFYFSEPLAPLVAARKHNRHISLEAVLKRIHSVVPGSACSEFGVRSSKFKVQSSSRVLASLSTPPATLLIEGAGGLLAPLGEPKSQLEVESSKFRVQGSNCYTTLDLINAIKCEVIVVAPNRLGTINHTLLTVHALRASKSRKIRVVLMDTNGHSSSRNTQHATRSNGSILAELLSPIPLFRIPYLAKSLGKTQQIHKFAKNFKKTLAQILA